MDIYFYQLEYMFSPTNSNQVGIQNGCCLSIRTCRHELSHCQPISFKFHLRNEFDFWNVHGIMNASGLLQSK